MDINMEKQKVKNRTELIVYVLVIFGLIAVVNYGGAKWFKRIDMTDSKQYSVSTATKKILKSLDDIINIKVFFSKDLPPLQQPIHLVHYRRQRPARRISGLCGKEPSHYVGRSGGERRVEKYGPLAWNSGNPAANL